MQRLVLLKYSPLITHTGMPIWIWHQLWERLTDSFFQGINSLTESFWGKLDLPWLLTLDFVCLLFYLQYRPVQTDAPATGAANIGGLNFSFLFERAEIQIPVNKYERPQRLSFSLENLFWGSFTSHYTGNYLRHGINITTNQRLSPTFRGKREHNYRRRLTDVSSPSWGRGDVCTQAKCIFVHRSNRQKTKIFAWITEG